MLQSLTPEQRRTRLHELIVMLCGAYARRIPLVIVVDELQWIDASSLEVLHQLATELAAYPILLILLYRPTARLDESWHDLAHSTSITLRHMNKADSEAFVAALLDGQPPPELQPIFERVDGTPFFYEEMVRYLQEIGALQRNSRDQWVCTPIIDSARLPLQIEQLIMVRLDRLDEDTRSLVQVMAAIGQHFPLQLLDAVIPATDVRDQQLRTLVQAEILDLTLDSEQTLYHFKHALLRDVAYSSMLFARRRTLHARIAGAIEHLYGANLQDYRVILARHYLDAEQPAQAFPHFLEAAHQAQARYANNEALMLYRQAAAIAPGQTATDAASTSLATTLYENMGDVLALTGDYVLARETYDRLLKDLTSVQGLQQAVLQRKIANTYEHQGMLDLALTWLSQAAVSITTAPPTDTTLLLQACILSDIGWVHFRQENLPEAKQYLEQALVCSQSVQNYEEQARILNRLGGVAYTHGNITLARSYVEQSLAASEQSGDLVGQAETLNNLGILTDNQGLLTESIQYTLRAIEINEQIGNRRLLSITMNNIGWAFYNMENYQEAYNYLDREVRQATEIHDTYHQMRALLNLGRVFLALQQLNAAEQTIFRSQSLAAQMDLAADQLDCHTVLGEIALQRGALAWALREYQEGLALDVDPQSEEYGRFQRLEARIAAAQGDRERAIELLKANEQLFRELQNMPEVNRTRKLLAELTAEPEQVPEQSSTPGEVR